MLHINFRNIFWLLCTVSIFAVGCSPAQIEIIEDEPDVVYSLSGLVNGTFLSFDENVIMVTNTDSSVNDEKVYEGTLFYGCEENLFSDCNGALTIRFFDDSVDQSTSLPPLLEAGSKTLREELVIPGYTVLRIEAMQPTDGIHFIDTVNYPQFHSEYPLTEIPVYPEFLNVPGLLYMHTDNPITSTYTEQYNILMSNKDGQIIYYYLDIQCDTQIPGRPKIKAELITNTQHTANDLDFIFGDEFKTWQEVQWPPFTSTGPFLGMHALLPDSPDTLLFDIFVADATLTESETICNSWTNVWTEQDTGAVFQTGDVVIEFVDENGNLYTSSGNNALDYFEIIKTESSDTDDFGNKTVISEIMFSAILRHELSDSELVFEDFKGKFAFAY